MGSNPIFAIINIIEVVFVFKLINLFAEKMTMRLCMSDGNNDNYDYYNFSLIAIQNFILYSIIGIIISLIFGYFPFSLISTIIIMTQRKYSGGCHGRTNLECQLFTAIILFICGMTSIYLSKYYLLFFVFSNCCWLGLDEIPRYTDQAKRHSDKKIKKIQTLYFRTLISFYYINVLFVFLTYFSAFNLSELSTCFSVCFIINKICLTDFAMKITRIERR